MLFIAIYLKLFLVYMLICFSWRIWILTQRDKSSVFVDFKKVSRIDIWLPSKLHSELEPNLTLNQILTYNRLALFHWLGILSIFLLSLVMTIIEFI